MPLTIGYEDVTRNSITGGFMTLKKKLILSENKDNSRLECHQSTYHCQRCKIYSIKFTARYKIDKERSINTLNKDTEL